MVQEKKQGGSGKDSGSGGDRVADGAEDEGAVWDLWGKGKSKGS